MSAETDLVFYYPEGHAAHFARGHPERPDRIESIVDGLKEAGWWEKYPHLDPPPLTQEDLLAVHTLPYLSLLETACQRGSYLDSDTYTTPASWNLALNAASGAAACAEAVWTGKASRAFALTRPPGHHAGPGYGMGFCLINNAAYAASRLLHNGASRTAVVDLDLHHGNGTQDIFYHRPDVLYISTHESPFYPGTGRAEERGSGEGLGATVNIPLPGGSGDEAFRSAMERVILPALRSYAPQMLILSAGFDTHWLDPLGGLQLSAAVTGELTARLVSFADEFCNGKIAVLLEGGYNLEATAAGACATTAALLGVPWDDPVGPAPYAEDKRWEAALENIEKILTV